MLGSELPDIVAQLKVTNFLLQEIIRLIRDLNETMPRCSCNDEHAVGDTWTCVFHGTVTKAQ